MTVDADRIVFVLQRIAVALEKRNEIDERRATAAAKCVHGNLHACGLCLADLERLHPSKDTSR